MISKNLLHLIPCTHHANFYIQHALFISNDFRIFIFSTQNLRKRQKYVSEILNSQNFDNKIYLKMNKYIFNRLFSPIFCHNSFIKLSTLAN